MLIIKKDRSSVRYTGSMNSAFVLFWYCYFVVTSDFSCFVIFLLLVVLFHLCSSESSSLLSYLLLLFFFSWRQCVVIILTRDQSMLRSMHLLSNILYQNLSHRFNVSSMFVLKHLSLFRFSYILTPLTGNVDNACFYKCLLSIRLLIRWIIHITVNC